MIGIKFDVIEYLGNIIRQNVRLIWFIMSAF